MGDGRTLLHLGAAPVLPPMMPEGSAAVTHSAVHVATAAAFRQVSLMAELLPLQKQCGKCVILCRPPKIGSLTLWLVMSGRSKCLLRLVYWSMKQSTWKSALCQMCQGIATWASPISGCRFRCSRLVHSFLRLFSFHSNRRSIKNTMIDGCGFRSGPLSVYPRHEWLSGHTEILDWVGGQCAVRQFFEVFQDFESKQRRFVEHYWPQLDHACAEITFQGTWAFHAWAKLVSFKQFLRDFSALNSRLAKSQILTPNKHSLARF